MTTARQRRRTSRRHQLLDAAWALAGAEGLEAVTMARLAASIDASVGGLYRYFPSKEAIFVALQEQAIASFAGAQRDALERLKPRLLTADPRAAALARVITATVVYLLEADASPVRHRLIDTFLSAQTPLLDDAQARQVDDALQPLLGRCAELLTEATTSATPALAAGDAMTRTHVLWASLHGLDHFRKRDRIQPPDLQVDMLTQETLRALLTGWGAEPHHVEEALDVSLGT